MKKIAILDYMRQAVDIIDIPKDADIEEWMVAAGYSLSNTAWMDELKAICFLNPEDFHIASYG